MSTLFASRLTAPLPAAIATIGVHGPGARQLVWSLVQHPRSAGNAAQSARSDQAFTREAVLAAAPATLNVGRIYFRHWPLLDGALFEEVVLCAVDSLTVEIHCHGGPAVSQAILHSLQAAGCQLIDQRQWRQRLGAQTQPPTDIRLRWQVESMLIAATSERSLGILLDQLDGALGDALRRLEQSLEDRRYDWALWQMGDLLRWKEVGRHLVEPWQVVLAGPPNVGKSSLINALTGSQQSIVHHEAGTTRDWIEAPTWVDGWPVCLTDTAGLRAAGDRVERQGVQRARQRIAVADLVVLVVDATVGWTDQHQWLIETCQQRARPPKLLAAWNKIDLAPEARADPPAGLTLVCCSAVQPPTQLLAALVQQLVPEVPLPGTAVPVAEEQIELLEQLSQRLGALTAPMEDQELQQWLQRLKQVRASPPEG